jgi:tryptophan synthase alpha subunit
MPARVQSARSLSRPASPTPVAEVRGAAREIRHQHLRSRAGPARHRAGFGVGIPTATDAITAYALGVMIGSPLITLAAAGSTGARCCWV